MGGPVTMRIDILSLFPGMFAGPFDDSILKRAQEQALLDINILNIRDYAYDKHRMTDDYPYGGGAGMVMKPEPIFAATEHLLDDAGIGVVPGKADAAGEGCKTEPRIVLLTPQGDRFDQAKAEEFALEDWLVLICGHYEGVDERVRLGLVTDEVSIGDYVLTGGEVAAMVIVDAVARLVPGVLGASDSAQHDSHSTGLLEHPHYTRPRKFRDMEVPEILLSGHHAEIRKWRRRQALKRTLVRRADMLAQADLSEEEQHLLAEVRAEFDRVKTRAAQDRTESEGGAPDREDP